MFTQCRGCIVVKSDYTVYHGSFEAEKFNNKVA